MCYYLYIYFLLLHHVLSGVKITLPNVANLNIYVVLNHLNCTKTLFIFLGIHLVIWVSLIAQLVKNPPAMQETLVQFLSQEDLCREDPLKKGQANLSSILGLPL